MRQPDPAPPDAQTEFSHAVWIATAWDVLVHNRAERVELLALCHHPGVARCSPVIAAMFSTVVDMANSLLAPLGNPNFASNIGSLVPFFAMLFLAKGSLRQRP